jgi:hypothetical protein
MSGHAVHAAQLCSLALPNQIRNTLRKTLDVFWLSARYSKRNEPINTYERSVSMLRNFFAKNAGQGMVILIAIYVIVITVVAGLMRMFGL